MSHFWFLFLFKQSKYPLSLKLVLNCVVTIHLQYFSSFRELCIALSRAGILYWFTYFFHYDMRVNKGRGRLSKWGVRACPKLVAHIYPGGLPLDLPIDKSNFPFWNMKKAHFLFQGRTSSSTCPTPHLDKLLQKSPLIKIDPDHHSYYYCGRFFFYVTKVRLRFNYSLWLTDDKSWRAVGNYPLCKRTSWINWHYFSSLYSCVAMFSSISWCSNVKWWMSGR